MTKPNSLSAPVKRNDDITLTIETLTGEGAGVGRIDGYAVFVVGALPGETVTAHIIKVTGSYAVARVSDVLTASPMRVTPRCPVFPRCGGCTLQHLSYEGQCRAKQQQVADALTRLGGFSELPMRPILGMETPWQYRNKGSFPCGTVGTQAVFGFYAERSHRLIPFSDCPIQEPKCTEIANRVLAWANENRILVYNEETHTGLLRHVMVRVTTTGEAMAVIVTNGPIKKISALLSALGDVESVWSNENTRDTNVIFGTRFTLLGGKPALTEEIGGHRFTVSPQSFLQVNAVETAVLYGCAVELLDPKPTETIVDAYCGIGTISLLLSNRAKRVIGIEQVPEAVADAKQNAILNGITNADFLAGDVEVILPTLLKTDMTPDALVLDPPRKGCDPAAIHSIADAGIARVVYVSCNPATLARDCKLFAERGYRIEAVQPVDMFPQTGHVETCVLITRDKKGQNS